MLMGLAAVLGAWPVTALAADGGSVPTAPLPSSALMGLALLGGIAAFGRFRRRRPVGRRAGSR